MMSSTMISGVPAKRSEHAKTMELFMSDPEVPRNGEHVPEEEDPEYDEEYDSERDMIFDNYVEDEDGWTKVQYTNNQKSEDQSRNFIICQNSQAARTPKQIIKARVQHQVTETAKAAAKASAPYVKAGIDCVTEGALRLAATETAGNWLRKVKGVVDKAVDTVTILQKQGNGER